MQHAMRGVVAGVWASTLAGTIACKDVNTNPGTVTSVELTRLVSPSIVLGDTLRDTLGVVQPLQGIAYNVQGDPVTDAPIRFRVLDTGLVLDSLSGIAVGTIISENDDIRLVADARGLQTQPQMVFVVPRPDLVETVTVGGLDSVLYTFRDTVLTSADLRLRVLHQTGTGVVPVRAYVVSFALESPDDTTFAQIVGDNGRASLVDTTGTDGIAGRRIRIRPPQLTTPVDSVVVLGTVKYRGVVLPGSPIRFVLQIKPKP